MPQSIDGSPLTFVGRDGTFMHPVVMAAVIIAILLILVLPRKYVVVPFLAVIFLIPYGEEVYVAGLHFYGPRLIILAGCVRIIMTKVLSRTEAVPGGLNALDKIFFFWATCRAMACVVLYLSSAAMINQGGFLIDTLGGYFVLRFVVRDEEDVVRTIKVMAYVCVFLSICLLNEKLRNQNVFGYVGGPSVIPQMREGSIRAVGPFGHPILAGEFAATLMALFFWLWKSGKAAIAGVAGMVGATVMVISSASSTPLLAYLAVVMGVCMWPLRKMMRVIRWSIVGLLIFLQIVMKSPVWFIITHVDLVAGNSGYHRAFLIDTFVRHFSDWWLIGTNAAGTWGFDMWDMSNQFVAEGEAGGLVTFILFVALISVAFSWIGTARKSLATTDAKKEWMPWLLGVALYSHVVGFFGISYWDQTSLSWYSLFVMISVVCVPLLKSEQVPLPETESVWANARSHVLSPASVSSKMPSNKSLNPIR